MTAPGEARVIRGSSDGLPLDVHDEALERVWRPRTGFWGWLTSVDHKSIGKRYIITAFAFFLLGGIEAGVMRMQLARPDAHVLGPDMYNQIFTMHGSTMMFLFAVPVMTAVAIYLVPLMVGARDVAFPRLNAFGYWTYLIGGLTLYAFFAFNSGPDAGWFSYVPLSGPQYTAGKRTDVWAQMITFTEIAGLVAAVEVIVTVFKCRAPGMSLNRIPVYVWGMLVVSFMIMFAMPSVAVGSMMLAMDRGIDTHFFNPAEGGDPLLWQHLFWFFGHPEVYIIFLPGLGFVTSIIETFTRRPVVGYPAIVMANVATGFLAFGLWVHHMFATPLPQLGQSFFTAASAMISIPTGIQIFCWIATIWTGKPQWKTPLLWVAGFFVVFIIGGLTGVMLASVPFDVQAHDTYFVVAHFHYVLIGGAVMPLFGAFQYWFPKVTGRMLSERLGKWSFWLFFIGMNVTFFPMHFLGLYGMPRRVYTYLPETGWGPLNAIESAGAVFIVLGVAAFLVNVAISLKSGAVAGANPWRASTLEWATSSPPPAYNFREQPVCESREPLWTGDAVIPVVTGLRRDRPEVLLTTLHDAEPDSRHVHPGPSIWPLAMALAVGVSFDGAIFTPWGILIGLAIGLLTLAGWAWPRHKDEPEPVALPEHA